MAAKTPFRVAPSPDRNPRGQFVSPPQPPPATIHKQADAEGIDVQAAGERVRVPLHSPITPWPAMKTDKPMRVG